MSEEEMTAPGVDRRDDTVRRNESARRLWVRRELENRRYGKGRRVWNRRVSAAAVEQETRTESRRGGVRRRIGDERRDTATRRHSPERRSSDRRVA